MSMIAVTTPEGPQPTTAYDVRSGLAVTPMLDNHQWWHVTHVASGLSLDRGFLQRQRAKAYQDGLLATAIDWTATSDELLRQPDVRLRVQQLLAQYPRY